MRKSILLTILALGAFATSQEEYATIKGYEMGTVIYKVMFVSSIDEVKDKCSASAAIFPKESLSKLYFESCVKGYKEVSKQ